MPVFKLAACDQNHRVFRIRPLRCVDEIRGDESFLDKSLGSIGVPSFDIVIARNDQLSIGFELAGDADAVLGPLAANANAAAEVLELS